MTSSGRSLVGVVWACPRGRTEAAQQWFLAGSPLLCSPLLSFPLCSSPFLSAPLLSSLLLSFPLRSAPLLSSLLLSFPLCSSRLFCTPLLFSLTVSASSQQSAEGIHQPPSSQSRRNSCPLLWWHCLDFVGHA